MNFSYLPESDFSENDINDNEDYFFFLSEYNLVPGLHGALC